GGDRDPEVMGDRAADAGDAAVGVAAVPGRRIAPAARDPAPAVAALPGLLLDLLGAPGTGFGGHGAPSRARFAPTTREPRRRFRVGSGGGGRRPRARRRPRPRAPPCSGR